MAKSGSGKGRGKRGASGKAVAATPVESAEALAARVRTAKLPGTPPDVAERARRLLLVYVETATARGVPLEEMLSAMASGDVALGVASFDLQRQMSAPPRFPFPACRAGCAFCCILTGEDGGTITEAEARRLHAELATMAGAPDGRAWQAEACAALDPETRMCRAYDARPMLCRSYVSADVEACEKTAAGTPTPGPGVRSAHVVFLALHALARAALKGDRPAPTYSLKRITSAAVDGYAVEEALEAARHPPVALTAERRRHALGWGAATGPA